MGPKQSQTNQFSEDKLNKNHFEFLHVVGKGGFGKYAFQDYDNLYLVMDLLTGGDLRYHISRHKRFSEEQTRFFVACIILGLEYVHGNKVIHRDIKPENLVLDERGYVRITDFGVAKIYQKDNSSETSGTPGYMAPEVMCAQNHSYFVDYFAVGVMAFEFMYGVRPYLGKSRKEIKELILAKQVQIRPGDIPDGWSIEAADFINKMLQRKPANRLGYNGITEIKDHPWLKYYPWRDLYEKNLEAPFVPKNLDNYDKKYCEGPDKIGNETLERYQNYYKNEALNEIFINYSFENLLSLPSTGKESNKINKFNSNSLTRKSKSGINSSNSNQSNSQAQTNSPHKKRINSSLGALAANNKNGSLNNLLKNKMKITESLYLNQPNNNSNNNVSKFNVNNNNSSNNKGNYISVNQSHGYISKPTPLKNRTSSLNMNSTNLKSSSLLSPNHVRNLSSNSNFSVALNYKQNNNSNININNNNLINSNNNSNTPNKNRSFNNLNLLKSRVKNLSINSSTNISNLTNIPASNVSVNNNANSIINPAASVILNPKQSSATPYRNPQIVDKTGSERLPFIEQKLANFRQFSNNMAIAKKISNSPSLKNSAKSAALNSNNVNVNNNANMQQKSGGAGKYSTLSASANSTGSSTVSVNFLHKRSGSTNTFNNY